MRAVLLAGLLLLFAAPGLAADEQHMVEIKIVSRCCLASGNPHLTQIGWSKELPVMGQLLWLKDGYPKERVVDICDTKPWWGSFSNDRPIKYYVLESVGSCEVWDDFLATQSCGISFAVKMLPMMKDDRNDRF